MGRVSDSIVFDSNDILEKGKEYNVTLKGYDVNGKVVEGATEKLVIKVK